VLAPSFLIPGTCSVMTVKIDGAIKVSMAVYTQIIFEMVGLRVRKA